MDKIKLDSIEDALDEEIRNVYYNEETKEAEIYI